MVPSLPAVPPYRMEIRQEKFALEFDMGRIVAFRGYWSGPLSLDAGRREGRGDVYRIGRRKEKARREHISLPSLYGLIAFRYSELVVD